MKDDKTVGTSPQLSPLISSERDSDDENVVKSRYESSGQSHVLRHLPTLPPSDRQSLLCQLGTIEVEKIGGYLSSALEDQEKASGSTGGITDDDETIRPLSRPVGRTSDPELVRTSNQIGLGAIRRGEVATLVLSGGQGTRLGFEGPKGMYDIGLPSRRTLFRLVSERIGRLAKLAGAAEENDGKDVAIPFYIMTSPLNHDTTISSFESQSYFGLPSSSVRFFPQGMLPCLTPEGKILMETPSKVAMAPDGNGGVYPSLHRSGMLRDMKDRGVKYLHVFSIDNALVRPADPVFVGYCISRNADCGNKVLWKTHPHEKVGVVAERDGKPCVVEYSDLDSETAERVDENGRLVFGAGNVCNHFYTLDFITDEVLPKMGTMYHVARKKIPCWDEQLQETVTPNVTNGIKLESFIFDVFPLSASMAVLDVERTEEFAPVKNSPGTKSDSPDTARKLMSDLAKRWVRDAGGTLVGDTESDLCEVSPMVSYSGEGLEDLVMGKEIVCPFTL